MECQRGTAYALGSVCNQCSPHHLRQARMKDLQGKEAHYGCCRINQCRAVRGTLDRWFGRSAGHGDGDACGKVNPDR